MIVTHGGLARQFRHTLEHVVGVHGDDYAIAIVDMADGGKDVSAPTPFEIIFRVDRDGFKPLTDMFGGTPSNLALTTLQDRRVEVIGGVNLPLIKFAQLRSECSLEEAVAVATQTGRKYIMVAGQILDDQRWRPAPTHPGCRSPCPQSLAP